MRGRSALSRAGPRPRPRTTRGAEIACPDAVTDRGRRRYGNEHPADHDETRLPPDDTNDAGFDKATDDADAEDDRPRQGPRPTKQRRGPPAANGRPNTSATARSGGWRTEPPTTQDRHSSPGSAVPRTPDRHSHPQGDDGMNPLEPSRTRKFPRRSDRPGAGSAGLVTRGRPVRPVWPCDAPGAARLPVRLLWRILRRNTRRSRRTSAAPLRRTSSRVRLARDCQFSPMPFSGEPAVAGPCPLSGGAQPCFSTTPGGNTEMLSSPTFAAGLASTPASLRCSTVIGDGAPVSGS